VLSPGSKEFTAAQLFSRFSGQAIVCFGTELLSTPHPVPRGLPAFPQASLRSASKTRTVNKIQGLRSQVAGYCNF